MKEELGTYASMYSRGNREIIPEDKVWTKENPYLVAFLEAFIRVARMQRVKKSQTGRTEKK